MIWADLGFTIVFICGYFVAHPPPGNVLKPFDIKIRGQAVQQVADVAYLRSVLDTQRCWRAIDWQLPTSNVWNIRQLLSGHCSTVVKHGLCIIIIPRNVQSVHQIKVWSILGISWDARVSKVQTPEWIEWIPINGVSKLLSNVTNFSW